MKPNEFQCAICHQIFIKGISDEDAYLQSLTLFGSTLNKDEAGQVCETCYTIHFPKILQMIKEGKNDPEE